MSPESENAPTRVLFLGGLGRSGTTVLERVLGGLPGVCSAGELVHLWQRGVLDDERCGCGEPFSRCAFWTAVGERAFGGWDAAHARRMLELRHRVDRTRHVPQLMHPRLLAGRRVELAEYVAAFEALYGAIAAVSGATVVVDSSKHSSLAFCLRSSRSVDLRVVHVVRDSRGVAYSWTKAVRRPESAEGAGLMTRYSPMRSSALWMGHNLCLALLGRMGTATRLLRYEDFVARPGATLRELADFAGIPVGEGPLSFLRDASVVLESAHTVAGNPVRFHTGVLTLRRDDAWRRELPLAQRMAVTGLTLPLLARYGYLRRQDRTASA
jgi:Sulfotransferase family